MSDRWVPTLGFFLAKVDGQVLVLKHGGLHVRPNIPDDEVMLRPIATTIDYDEGVRIIQALRDGAVTSDVEVSDV